MRIALLCRHQVPHRRASLSSPAFGVNAVAVALVSPRRAAGRREARVVEKAIAFIRGTDTV